MKKINGEVISANFKDMKKKDDPNRIVAESKKDNTKLLRFRKKQAVDRCV